VTPAICTCVRGDEPGIPYNYVETLRQACAVHGAEGRPVLLDLPHGHQALIDKADWPLIAELTLYRGTNGYVYFSKWVNGKSYPQMLHVLLMQPPKGSLVDHRNGNKLDNRRENLRITTPSINQINRHYLNQNNSSGFRGVSYAPKLCKSKPWRVQITVNRKNKHVGLFATAPEAIAARREAELREYGELCPAL